MLSVYDNLCKQFNTLMVTCLKEFLEKVDFEKNQETTKKHEKIPSRQRVNFFKCLLWKTLQTTKKACKITKIVLELKVLVSFMKH